MSDAKVIETEYKGYVATSTDDRLFTVKNKETDQEYMAVWRLPVKNKTQCSRYLKSALKFLSEVEVISKID